MNKTALHMATKAGNENKINPATPPQNEAVAYIDIAVSIWVEVGPGMDWQIVSSSTNFSLFMLCY